MLKMKSQTERTTRAPKGQTALGEMGDRGNLLPIDSNRGSLEISLHLLSCLLFSAYLTKIDNIFLFLKMLDLNFPLKYY